MIGWRLPCTSGPWAGKMHAAECATGGLLEQLSLWVVLPRDRPTIRVAALLMCWLRAPKRVSYKSRAQAASCCHLGLGSHKGLLSTLLYCVGQSQDPARFKGRELHSPVGGTSVVNMWRMCVCLRRTCHKYSRWF